MRNALALTALMSVVAGCSHVDQARSGDAAGATACLALCPPGFGCNEAGQCVGGDLSNLRLNEAVHVVSGSVTVNGAPPTKGVAYCSGQAGRSIARLTFREPSRGYKVETDIPCGADWDFSATLPEGIWDVRLMKAEPGADDVDWLLEGYLVASGLVVDAPKSNLVLNMVEHAISGSITVNGAPLRVDTEYCGYTADGDRALGSLTFIEASGRYKKVVTITCGTAGHFSVTLPSGTWDARLDAIGVGRPTHINLLPFDALVARGLVVDGPKSNLVLDEAGHAVSGTIAVNGAPPTMDMAYCGESQNANAILAVLTFKEVSKDYRWLAHLTCSTGWDFSETLPPGTWDVSLALGQWADRAGVDLLPFGYPVASGLVVDGPKSNLVLNEVLHTVSGTITVNGAPPTKDMAFCGDSRAADFPVGWLTFTEVSERYQKKAIITCSTGWDFSVALPAGTWDVRLKPSPLDEGDGSRPFPAEYLIALGLMENRPKSNLHPVDYVVASKLVVDGPKSNLVLKETVHAVSGSVTVNGAPPTKDMAFCAGRGNAKFVVGRLTFVEESEGYEVEADFTCNTGWDFSVSLPEGTWKAVLERVRWADNAGVNFLPFAYVVASGLVVDGPKSNLVLDEVAHVVSGTITVNGAPPTMDAAYCRDHRKADAVLAVLSFREALGYYRREVAMTCSTGWDFSVALPAGTWDIRLAPARGGATAGVNLMPFKVVVASGLVVDGPKSDLVLNQGGHVVSGTITVSGAPPTKDLAYCGERGNADREIALLSFKEASKHYEKTVELPCSAGWDFSVSLPSGNWDIRLAPGRYAAPAGVNLLPYEYTVVSGLLVP